MPVPQVLSPFRLRLVALVFAAGLLSLLSGCYSEFMGPAPGSLTLVRDQPGGSFRTGSVQSTEYQVHLFWGIWSPKKTNSWQTLTTAVQGRGADGAYDVQIETYMPWWHIFIYGLTGGIVEISGHTIKAETFKYPKAAPAATSAPIPDHVGPAPPPALTPPTTPPPPPPPPPPVVTGPADQPMQVAPKPGRAPVTDPNAPKPVADPQGSGTGPSAP